MPKYHINPETGNPNICKTKEGGKCPFTKSDTSENHYDSKAEALKAYEDSQAAELQKSHQKEISLQTIKEFSEARIGTLVIDETGEKFLKVNDDTWSSKNEGGYFMTDEEMSESPTPLKVLREAKVQNGLKVISTSALMNSTFENAYAARAYLRLLNHQNYDQAKALYGKVKDSSVIEAVKESHKAVTTVESIQENIRKAEYRLGKAINDEQRAGYARNLELVKAKKIEALKAVDEANEKIEALKSKYAKQLAIHNGSLKSLEKAAASEEPLLRPEGITERIASIEASMSKTKRVGEIGELAKKDSLDSIVKATQIYGNSYYVEAATRLRQAVNEEKELKSEVQSLINTSKMSDNAAVQQVIDEQLEEKRKALRRLEPTISSQSLRVVLFQDEIRDRELQENTMIRELAALKTIEEKTRT